MIEKPKKVEKKKPKEENIVVQTDADVISDEAVNSALEEFNKQKDAKIKKMIDDGAAIASKQQDEITEELVNETVSQ